MSRKSHKTVLLFGAPGSGKGTQGRILGTIPGFFHLSCGDVFRSLDIGSRDGREAVRFSSRGELAPDDLTVRIWSTSLHAHIGMANYKPHEDLLILDGIPRNVTQAELLREHIDVLGVIDLVCRDEESMFHRIQRRAIKENRADDASEQVIRHRFAVYREESEPVLACYPPSIVSLVDAMGSPAEVLRATLDCVIPIQNRHFHSERA